MWESYNIVILKREIFAVSSPPLSHCHTLRGVFTQKKTHTYSECREYFGVWEALGLCQIKQVRLGGAIGWYCRFGKLVKIRLREVR